MIGPGERDHRIHAGPDPVVESRIIWLAAGLVVFFGILGLRLFVLQIVDGADLLDRSVRNSVRTERVEAPRGDIVDREGRLLATTRPAYRVSVIPSELANPEKTWVMLGALLDLDPAAVAERVGTPSGRDRFRPIVIAEDLDRAALLSATIIASEDTQERLRIMLD